MISWIMKIVQIIKYIPGLITSIKAIYDLITGKETPQPTEPVSPDEDNKPKRRKRWWRRG